MSTTPYMRSYMRSYRRTNPKEVLYNNARQRAKRDNLPFTITHGDFEIPEVCPVLGIPLFVGVGKCSDNSPSLDRHKPELVYIPGNIVVMSFKANTLKQREN